jgi:hypothetical protein
VLVDLGDLGLRGWQSLGGFLVFRVIRVDDLDQVLLITHSWVLELFILCYKLLLLLHRYGSPFHHHLSLLLLPLLKTLSCGTMSGSILQLFCSASGGFGAFSTLDLILWCLDQARTWGGRSVGR